MSRSPPPPRRQRGRGEPFPASALSSSHNDQEFNEKKRKGETRNPPPPSFQATQGFMGKGEREDKRPSSSSSLPVSAEQGPAYPFPLPSSSPFLSPSILHPFTRRGTHCSVSREKGF